MSHKLMAVLLSSALVLGNVSTSAWSATDVSGATLAQPAQVANAVDNTAPLPPAGAAGIKQAQGFVQDYPLLSVAILVGVIALVWILVDDDDDDSSSGTN